MAGPDPGQLPRPEGYFLGKDMNSSVPMNAAEVKEDMDRQRREGLIDDKGNTYRKVYAADGKTVLGKIKVGTFSKK